MLPETCSFSLSPAAVAALLLGLLGPLGCSSGSKAGDAGAGSPDGSGPGAAASGGGGARARIRTDGDGAGGPCPKPGATRACCGTATQTCNDDGFGEFSTWGPCLDTGGDPVDCITNTPGKCGEGEFAHSCDAGSPSDGGSPCVEGEFSSACGNLPDGGLVLDGSVPPPPPPPACDDREANNEPEILAAYSPAEGETVSQCGEVKVWVNDEWAAFIAPNEQVDSTTGVVTAPGDRSARAPDGYLYEPALYIENAAPIFPTHIKGWYNNDPLAFVKGKGGAGKANAPGVDGAPIDPAPAGTDLSEKYTTEFVWNLCSLGLPPGTYTAKFVVADGDTDRAIGCVTIVVTP